MSKLKVDQAQVVTSQFSTGSTKNVGDKSAEVIVWEETNSEDSLEKSGVALVKEEDKIDAEFKKAKLGLTEEQVKAEKKRLGIPTSHFLRKDKTETIIQIHDDAAKEIYKIIRQPDIPDDVYEVGMKYIKELPKAQRNRNMADYQAACQAKIDAFRNYVGQMGLAKLIEKADKNAQARYEEGEAAADVRTDNINKTVVNTGKAVIENVNKHTDNSNAEQTKNVNNNINRAANGVMKHVTKETNRVIDNIDNRTEELKGHVTNETNRGADKVNKHTDESNANQTKKVNDHTTKEANRVNANTNRRASEIKLTQQQTQVLLSKRQALADMLGHEDGENFGVYRDSTVKWLGAAADKVISETKLTFEEKLKALDELIKMVDEESLISDGNKNDFECRYFKKK